MVSDEIRAGILHEHYNSTFANIQANIAKRERLLFILILLVVVMLFQMASPIEASPQISALISNKLGLATPCDISFIDSVLWFAMLCLLIRYFQTSGYVERQYSYIHAVEAKLNQLFGNDDITREGKAYLSGYPRFSYWTHFIYTVALPLLLGIILSFRWGHEISCAVLGLKIFFDTAMFLACLVSILFYLRLMHRKK